MRTQTFIALFTLSFAGAAVADESAQPITAVGLRGRRVDTEMLAVIEDLWMKSFPAGFKVQRASDLGKPGTEARACPDAGCVAQKLKGTAELAIRGDVSRLGGTYFVRVELIDTASGSIERSTEAKCGAQEDELRATIDRATAETLGVPEPKQQLTSDAPVAAPKAPTSVPTASVERYVRVENKNRKRALYASLGGAVAASSGVLLVVSSSPYDSTAQTLGGTLITTGLAAFVVGGVVYIISPEYNVTKTTVAPIADGKQVGVAVSGRF